MTNTIFCLSMPGGHMTYLAVLSRMLMQQIPVDKSYITKTGSLHYANNFFNDFFVVNDWNHWHDICIKNYTIDTTCVVKSEWDLYTAKNWENCLNTVKNGCCLISSPASKLDWYYCYLNIISKVPQHIYRRLTQKNLLSKILLKKLNKGQKIKLLSHLMPPHSLKENLDIKIPHLRLATTDLLEVNSIDKIHQFLKFNNYNTLLTKEIVDFHIFFAAKQKENYLLAHRLVNNEFWEPRGPFDQILFNWIATNPWEGLE